MNNKLWSLHNKPCPQAHTPSNYFLKGNQGEYYLYDQSHLKTLQLDKTYIACTELCMYICLSPRKQITFSNHEQSEHQGKTMFIYLT